MDAFFVTLSFVGSNALADQLGNDGVGVYVTQVVPFPRGGALPVVGIYNRALSEYKQYAVPGFVSLEGYLAGRLAIYGLGILWPRVKSGVFLESLRDAETIDIDGFQLSFGKDDNQGSDAVFLTTIAPDGGYRPVTTMR